MAREEPKIVEDDSIRFGEVWWSSQTRTAFVHPQHAGSVYYRGNLLGVHEPRVCPNCGCPRPDHQPLCP